MQTYKVMVEKMLRVSGVIEVRAKNAEAAEKKVQKMIDDPIGPLQTDSGDILWDEPSYEDDTFKTTGDVEFGGAGIQRSREGD